MAKMRALVIEDDARLAELIKHYLAPIADPVIIAKCMAEAEAIIRSPEPIDLITLDVKLPDSEGVESLHHITPFKAAHPEAVLFVVTGEMDKQDEAEAIRNGADAFILKSDVRWTSEGLLSTLGDIFRSILAQPKRYLKSVDLLESATEAIGEVIQQKEQCAVRIVRDLGAITEPDREKKQTQRLIAAPLRKTP